LPSFYSGGRRGEESAAFMTRRKKKFTQPQFERKEIFAIHRGEKISIRKASRVVEIFAWEESVPPERKGTPT